MIGTTSVSTTTGAAVLAQLSTPRPGIGSRRRRLIWGLAGAYAALTALVVVGSWPVRLDERVARLRFKINHPELVAWIRTFELAGQRGPTLLVFAPLVVWQAWRRRDASPVIALVTAEVLLNLSVGVVKYAVGRVGPFAAGNAHLVFAGGDIYPSGHVSNAVVLYGLLATLSRPAHRRRAVVVATLLCAAVGLGTIFLRTHWVTDVVGGWLAGGLVLAVLPAITPTTQRWADRAWTRFRARRARVPDR